MNRRRLMRFRLGLMVIVARSIGPWAAGILLLARRLLSASALRDVVVTEVLWMTWWVVVVRYVSVAVVDISNDGKVKRC